MSEKPLDQEDLVTQTRAMEDAMRKAVREALRCHKQLGNPISVWRNGRVEWIPPEEIRVPGENGANGGQ